ncbi:MAG: 5-dehydro-4-deoxy-D-glucuronate isomerase [Beijerinckiaceae bacterium]
MTDKIEVRHSVHPTQAETFGTADLRGHFHIPAVFAVDDVSCVYLHDDRMMVMGCSPVKGKVVFPPAIAAALRAEHLLERRELGIFNVGGPGTVSVDGVDYAMGRLDGLYVGRGARDVSFRSSDPAKPARFYMNSAPAHASHPHQLLRASDLKGDELGAQETANRRILTKYIHPGNGPSCQLVMGITQLQDGSVWNTMPAHTHDRRMETYLYFDVADDAAVMHFMGRPQATRHIVMRDGEAVVSPPWSIHSGAGTKAYSFVWSMAGENQAFTDMDAVPVGALL